jgi:flavin-dependent dehydrogenase
VPELDALLVGAGPAGLATSIGLARRGARVLVLEHRVPPLDTACGEGIMPAGEKRMSEEERWHVVNYVRTLAK